MQFLSTTSVAKRWDCSPDYVRKLVREGVIRAISLSSGRRTAYRISLREIEHYECKVARRANQFPASKISAAALKFAKGEF